MSGKLGIVYWAAAMNFSQKGDLQTYQNLQSEAIRQDRSVPVLGKTVILSILPMMAALG